jgi:hypothetical protein
MYQRKIDTSEVRYVIEHGEVIEDYPNDTPWPSRLLFAVCQGRPMHVVAAWDEIQKAEMIITAYVPSLSEWSSDYRRRLT